MGAFGIIADDLTGACDVGGAFARAGCRVVVDLCRGAVQQLEEGEVLVVDAGLRDAEAVDVRPAMERSLERLRAAGADFRMLKVDSTLRGPVSGMIATALGLGAFTAAVVAPAFPEQGRRLVNGRLVVHGADTGVSLEAKVGGLGARVRLTVGESLTTVLESVWSEETSASTHVVVVDAETSSDLAATAHAWLVEPRRTLLVGSAGLARHVAKVSQHGPRSSRMPSRHCNPKPADSWSLVVAGSPEEATRRQRDVLVTELGCEMRVLSLSGEGFGIDTVSTDLNAKTLVVGPPLGTVRDRGEIAAGLAAAVGTMAAMSSESRDRPAGLVLVGGDTAARVLAALSVESLEVCGEMEVGMPVVQLGGGPWDGIVAITKAGGFGGERALVSAIRFLEHYGGKARS